jgi:hypothetical protein
MDTIKQLPQADSAHNGMSLPLLLLLMCSPLCLGGILRRRVGSLLVPIPSFRQLHAANAALVTAAAAGCAGYLVDRPLLLQQLPFPILLLAQPIAQLERLAHIADNGHGLVLEIDSSEGID